MGPSGDAIPQVTPLFPLPDVVLFPGAVLPLHVFEPRYRAMTEDALRGARVISIALLKPGFEPLYYTLDAPIHRYICLGRIVRDAQLPNGHYLVSLVGWSRVRIVEELRHPRYRVARIQRAPTLRDVCAEAAPSMRRALRSAVSALPQLGCLQRSWLDLFETEPDLEGLIDRIAGGLPVCGEVRQVLLAEPRLSRRYEILCDNLRSLGRVCPRTLHAQPESRAALN